MIRQRCIALLHRVASTGWGYDLCSCVTGERVNRPKWQAFFHSCRGLVLDVGGGTGYVGDLLPAGCSYICLDMEMPKLKRHSSARIGSGLLADATQIPLRAGTVDSLTCLAVTHHLRDEELDAVFREVDRVMKPGGRFLLADAVWKPARLRSRVLWALDRGANPRSPVDLQRFVDRHFSVLSQARFAFHHEYVTFVCAKKDQLAGARNAP